MRSCVYLGLTDGDLGFGHVYEWRGDVLLSTTGARFRRIGWDTREWLVPTAEAPFTETMPLCPECGGDCLVEVWDRINYGPHPDAPEYGDVIQNYSRLEWCDACRGIGVSIDWSWDLAPQRWVFNKERDLERDDLPF